MNLMFCQQSLTVSEYANQHPLFGEQILKKKKSCVEIRDTFFFKETKHLLKRNVQYLDSDDLILCNYSLK